MKTLTKTTSALLISALLSTNISAAERESKVGENTGFGGGAIIGAIVGGPLGAIIGAAGGAVIGHEIDEKTEIEAENEKNLAELTSLQQELTLLNHQLASASEQASELKLQKVSLESGLNNLSQEISTDFHFATNQVEVSPRYHEKMDNLATFLKKHDQFKIVVNGYADARGTEHDNLKLSLDRVKNVESYLVSKGVAKQQIIMSAFGEQNAVQQVTSAEDYAFDRKVSVQLLMAPMTRQTVASN